jgi:hypothetical protein
LTGNVAQPGGLERILHFEHLTAAIHAGLQIYMMRAMQFAGIRAFHISVGLNGIVRTAHTSLGWRGFPLRNSHGCNPLVYYRGGLGTRRAAPHHLNGQRALLVVLPSGGKEKPTLFEFDDRLVHRETGPDGGMDLGDHAIPFGAHHIFHLHRLNDGEFLANLDHFTLGHRDRNQ